MIENMTNEQAAECLKTIHVLSFKDETATFFLTDVQNAFKLAIKALEQTRPKGKWKILDECANEGVYCSKCHKTVFKLDFSHTMKWRNFKYCPNCGARMEVEE